MANYVLAQAYAGVQFWNADKSDLTEVRRQPGEQVVDVPTDDIHQKDLYRLLDLGAIVEKGSEDEAAEPPAPESPAEPAGNASTEEWAKYADSLGLVVEPGAGREDIKQQIADSRS